jgi:hypothetical protein
MHAKAAIIANRKIVASAAWNEPLRDGQNKHVRFLWGKRGGTGKMSGNGPSGRRATPRALLARTLANRPLVAATVTARQAARVEAKKYPPKIIYGAPE